jgi:hypothetical protein
LKKEVYKAERHVNKKYKGTNDNIRKETEWGHKQIWIKEGKTK